MTVSPRSSENRVTAFMDTSRSMAGNVIHSDQGAKDFGFRSALVIGGNVYGWSVPAILDLLGEEWLWNGWAKLTFRRPTYVGDEITAHVQETAKDRAELSIRKAEGEVCIYGEVGLGEAPWLPELEMPSRLKAEPRPEERIPLTMENAPIGQDLHPIGTHVSVDEAVTWARDRQADENPLWYGAKPLVHPGWINGRMTPLMIASYSYNPSLVSTCEMQHLGRFEAGQDLTLVGKFRDVFERNGNSFWRVDGAILGQDGKPLVRIRQSNLFKVAKRDRDEAR